MCLMKKLMILLAAAIGFAAYSANAQSVNYLYLDGETFTSDGVTMVVEDVNPLFFAVQNAQNELASQAVVDAEGNEVSPFDIVGGKIDRRTIKAAFDATFTKEEAVAMRDNKTRMSLCLTSDNTGKVLEVVFVILRKGGYSLIPPAKYVAFEKNLKEMVRWAELSEDEKRFPFTHTTLLLKMDQLVPIERTIKDDGIRLPDSLQLNL